MPLRFIHLSDIHFGQEKGHRVHVHSDVRDQVVADASQIRNCLPDKRIDGVLVTGDLAFSGAPEEYAAAGAFLDALTSSVGCLRTAVRVIPGNHDIHRDSICKASDWMLLEIAEKGIDALDSFLVKEQDRDVLYGRLRHYEKFAGAYDCPLDGAGGIAGQVEFSLATGRTLRFIGLNSALTCGKNDEAGKLLLGAKQWVLPRTPGEELVVLCHHPLHWFRDSSDAQRYVRSRARVFISGHEHSPSFGVEHIEDGCDLLILSAGATTPPQQSEAYQFTYNIIEFEWDQQRDGLRVSVAPRVWCNDGTRFKDHTDLPGRNKVPVVLGCPNFRSAPLGKPDESPLGATGASFTHAPSKLQSNAAEAQMDNEFSLQLLRFFRDLTGAQRLAVLIRLGALPGNRLEPLNQSAERRALEKMKIENRIPDLKSAIDDQLTNNENGSRNNG